MRDMMTWTEESEAELMRLWKAGFSASQIAGMLASADFRPTRNAVIGKVHRMHPGGGIGRVVAGKRGRSPVDATQAGLQRRAAPVAVKTSQRQAGHEGAALQSRRQVRKAASSRGRSPVEEMEAVLGALNAPPPAVEELYVPEDQRLTLLQLNEHTCKWPIGDPLLPGFYFCGQGSEDGKPYCAFHTGRATARLPAPPRVGTPDGFGGMRRLTLAGGGVPS